MANEREVSLVDKLKSTNEGRIRHLTERAIVRVTKQIEEAMEIKGVNRTELAKRLGRSKGWVTQLLDGENNKTIRTLAYVFAVLDAQFETGYIFNADVKPVILGATAKTGEHCPESGVWKVEGTPSVTAPIAKGNRMPTYEDKAVTWELIQYE